MVGELDGYIQDDKVDARPWRAKKQHSQTHLIVQPRHGLSFPCLRSPSSPYIDSFTD
jgi:hypothetical protein